MNTQKLFILLLLAIVLAILIFVFGRLVSSARKKSVITQDGGDLAQSLHTSLIFISLAILVQHGLKKVLQSIEILFNSAPSSTLLIFKSLTIFVGITFIWYLIIFYLSYLFNQIIRSKESLRIAIENNNYDHILLFNALLIALSLALLPIYSALLNLFVPDHINQIIY